MFKFLRRIRQSLLKENKTGQYFKYAIGEILLVMIGILLALQVNNWNENRKDRAKEELILEQLHSEFKENLEKFYEIKRLQLNTLNSGNIVFRNMDKMDVPESRDSVLRYATGMFGGYPYYPSNGVVQSLISSGEVNLIRNDSLKNYLVSWQDVLNDYTEDFRIDGNFWSTQIEPYIIRHGDFLNVSNEKNRALLQDPVFINMLVRKQFFQKNIINSMIGEDGLEHYMKEIVRLSRKDH